MNTSYIVRRLLSGSVLRVAAVVVTAVVAFFMMPFLVHTLGDEQYGLWVVVGSIVGFYGFFDIGLATAVGKYTAGAIGKQDYDEVNKVANTALALFLSLGLIVILLSFVGAGLILWLKEDDTATLFAALFAVMGTNIGLQFPMRTFSGVLTSQMRFDLLVYVHMFKLFSRTALIVWFVSNGYGILTMAVVTVITEIFGNLLELYLVRKNGKFLRISFKYVQRGMIKQLAKYSWAAFVTNVSEMARSKLVPVFVAVFLGLPVVVIYSIAQRLLEYMDLLMKNCIGFIMPVLSRFEGENNTALVKKTFEYATIAGVAIVTFIAGSIIFYGKPFITLWMGEQYVQSYDILLIMLVPMVFITMQLPSKDLLFAISKHKIFAALSSGSVLLMSLISVIMAQSGLTYSIAIAFTVGVTIFEIIKPWYVAEALNEKVSKIYMMYVNTFLRSALILGLYAFVVYSVNITSYMDILILVTLQSILYLILGYFIIVPEQLRNVAQNTIVLPLIKKVRA